MPLALSDLFSEETRDEVLSTLLSVAETEGLKVSAWQPGQPIRTLLTIIAQKISDLTLLTKEAVKGGLLDYAEEGWLDLLAQSVYRVTRNGATFATGDSLRFVNGSGEVQDFEPGDLIVAHAVTGKTYRNTATLSLAPGTTDDIALIADEAGSASNAAPGSITELVSSAVDCTVTNVAAILGSDVETDEQLRKRCRAKLGALSPNGPKEAYRFVATTPALDDGTPLSATSVPITRVKEILNEVTGVLRIILATDEGAPVEDDVDIVDEAIDVWAAPWGTKYTTEAAVEVEVDIDYQIWIAGSNLTLPQIATAIENALIVYFKTIDIGGFEIPPDVGRIFKGALETVITTATPGIIKVDVTTPGSDLILAEDAVAILGTVTPTITVVT